MVKCENNANISYFYNNIYKTLITEDYATPGTVEDTYRPLVVTYPSFNIKGHGCILSFNEKGELLK